MENHPKVQRMHNTAVLQPYYEPNNVNFNVLSCATVSINLLQCFPRTTEQGPLKDTMPKSLLTLLVFTVDALAKCNPNAKVKHPYFII